eukprot:547068-Amphidinium_carterae.1
MQPLPLGVEEKLPPTPGIFQTKLASQVTFLPDDELRSAVNYPSATEHSAALVDNFLKDVSAGLVAGPFATAEQAAQHVGCQASQLVIGALAARPEGHKTRTIYDASVTQVNDNIRAHIPEKTEAPGAADLRHILALEHAAGHKLLAMKMDVSSAHRRIRIARKDWRYMVALCEGAYYANEVGTFGVASAQWYWGRVAALLNLVFVDDFLALHQAHTAHQDRMSILILMLIIAVPISWGKTQFSERLQWIGIDIDLAVWVIRPSPDKLPGLLSFLETIAQGHNIRAKSLQRVLGQLSWYTGIFPHLKVFLPPLYAWLHAMQSASRPSKHLKATA